MASFRGGILLTQDLSRRELELKSKKAIRHEGV
jgi:hypothetical protein